MNYLLIVDYNLSRVNDVRRLRQHAQAHGLKSILIRPQPSAIDIAESDVVLDLNPRAAGFIDAAVTALAPYQISAALVFSDNAVQTGAALVEQLGLKVDNARLAQNAFSKAHYRAAEQQCKPLLQAQKMFVPKFHTIKTEADLRASLAESAAVVLKPSCEGNNRGVIMLSRHDDLTAALREVAPYFADGIISEERIEFAREYSYDGVAHLNWLTEKLCASGRYPVEIGQVVPANVNLQETNTLCRVGRLANLLVGQSEGPFHNEIKLSDDGLQAAVVEPNRRPAGMKIWNLAHKVYGLDFYKLWLDSALDLPLPASLPAANGKAATIMLGAPCDGVLPLATRPDGMLPLATRPDGMALLQGQVLPALLQSEFAGDCSGLEWFEFAWLNQGDTPTRVVPRDNSEFLAQICLYSNSNTVDMVRLVHRIQQLWRTAIGTYIQAGDILLAA